MRVEREIAAVAFPFAAGVVAAVILGASPCIIKPTYPIMALTVTLLSVWLLLQSSGRRWSHQVQWSILTLCMLSCGTFIGISALELRVSELEAEGALSRWALITGEKMKSAIDNIAFECESTGGIIKALLTGDRSALSPDITQAFRDSGASHILALSGLHLGIIYVIISKLLSFGGNSSHICRVRAAVTIVLCGIYTLATGAGASITRAYIFIILKEVAEMTGRHTSLKSILAATLIIHLGISPTAAADIGFQLSYAAMFGIAYIFPYLRRIWTNDWKGLRWIWESAALSISCQLTTGPLAWYYFGTFPQYFLLTNLLAIPLTGLLIPAALLCVALTAIGWCPDIVVEITEWITQTMLEALSVIACM